MTCVFFFVEVSYQYVCVTKLFFFYLSAIRRFLTAGRAGANIYINYRRPQSVYVQVKAGKGTKKVIRTCSLAYTHMKQWEGLCKVKMRTADADDGRRTADNKK